MKSIRIVQAVVLLGIVAVLTSCGTSRQYESYPPPPPPRPSVSLIINPSPGMVISRYPGNRYYYRSPQGITYWRGYDNRYYIDRSYMKRTYYRHNQYNDWKRHYRR